MLSKEQIDFRSLYAHGMVQILMCLKGSERQLGAIAYPEGYDVREAREQLWREYREKQERIEAISSRHIYNKFRDESVVCTAGVPYVPGNDV